MPGSSYQSYTETPEASAVYTPTADIDVHLEVVTESSEFTAQGTLFGYLQVIELSRGGGTGIALYDVNTDYSTRDSVIKDEKIYIANGNVPSGTAFAEGTTGATWKEISAGGSGETVWKTSLVYNSGTQSGPTATPIVGFNVGNVASWDASNPAINSTHSANDVITIQNYGNITGVTLTISANFDYKFFSGGSSSFLFQNLGADTSNGQLTFTFNGDVEFINSGLSSSKTFNVANSSISNAQAGTITSAGISDGSPNETFNSFTLETSLLSTENWEIYGNGLSNIAFTNYGGTTGANVAATHFATQYTDGTDASYRIVSLADHTTTVSGTGSALPAGWVEAVQTSVDRYLGYKTTRHTTSSDFAVTDADHNLTDLHIEGDGDLTIAKAAVSDGTSLYITNTTAVDRSLTFTNFSAAYLRNGGAATDVSSGTGLTLKANTRYLVHITDNGGNYFFNATEAGGGASIADGTTNNNTLRWDGTAWVESAALTNDGTDVTATGKINAKSINIFDTEDIPVGEGTGASFIQR